MTRFLSRLARLGQILVIVFAAVATYLGAQWGFGGERTVSALPEFTARTGEPCAACHVNPGGGGPRTLRGLLWAARGRPDAIPELPGMLIAANVTDGLELYDITCAGCHGYRGEGLSAIDLAGRDISQGATRAFIEHGIPALGMPGFGDQLTDEQIDALTAFVVELGRGQILPSEYPLPPPEFTCIPLHPDACGGN